MLIKVFNSMSLEKLYSIKDFDTFKSLCLDIKTLSREDYNLLTKDYYNKNSPLLWQVHWGWCKSTNQAGNVYMVITRGNTRATLLMKITQIYSAKFITLIDVPLTDDEKLKLDILNHLKSLNFFKFIFKEEYLNYYKEEEYKELPSYYDYYYNLEDLDFSNKWQKKNKIKRYFTDDFTIEITNIIYNIEEVIGLRNTWANALSNKYNSKVSNNILFNKATKCNCPGVLWYNIYYKGVLIASSCVGLDNGYALWFFEVSIGRVKKHIKDDYLRASIQNITNVLLYFIREDLLSRNITRLYIAGCSEGHSTQNLVNHKKSTTQGYIKYYKVN